MPSFPELTEPPRIHRLGVGQMPVPGITRWPLRGHWALHLYGYQARVSYGDVSAVVRPGMASVAPPGSTMVVEGPAVSSTHVYVLFLAPLPPEPRAVFLDLGPDWQQTWDRLALAVTAYETEPARAAARLWDVLWEWRALAAGGGQATPAAVQTLTQEAARYIEQHLDQPLRVADVATAVGVSHNHLTRSFRQVQGQTVVAYLRARRVARARDLLVTTRLPMKQIAAMVGFADAQQFNKAVRRELGRSPSAVRQQDPAPGQRGD